MANTKKQNSNESNENIVKESVQKKMIAKEIDSNQLVPVYNGFQGKLIYISPRTKEIFEWESFGDTQEIELKELRNTKSSAKKFFINNWFMFDDDYQWVIDYLGVGQYYKHSLSLDNFDNLFTMSPTEIEKTVSQLSKGQKKSVIYRAHQLIANNEIDSNKVIIALEKALGAELIER